MQPGMKHEHGQTLDYATLPRPKRRPFLARPFWRDYVLAFVCLVFGVMLGDVGAAARGPDRLKLLGIAAALAGTGLVIFCCAVGYSVWSTLRRSDGTS